MWILNFEYHSQIFVGIAKMVNGQLGAVVNENPIYKDFQFNPFTIESFLSFSPFIYIIPTFVIIFRIFRIFLNTVLWKKKSPINHSVFIVLVLSQISVSFWAQV